VVHPLPRAEKKIWGPNLQKKKLQLPPDRVCTPSKKSNCLRTSGDLDVGVVNLLVLAYVLKATTKKKVVNFFRRTKVHHRENPGYAYVLMPLTTSNTDCDCA